MDSRWTVKISLFGLHSLTSDTIAGIEECEIVYEDLMWTAPELLILGSKASPQGTEKSSVTGSAFRGFILVLQNNSMLQDTQMSRSNMGAFQCIHRRNPSSPSWLNEVKVDLNGHCALIG